ncbi:orc1 [Symbiodinium sp. CCMP2592]|nr:orc1 [Symbiodinium sp. CCMP2592]
MARVWGDGYGRQCPRHPRCGTQLCGLHKEGLLAHGRVDEPVPPAKLKQMEEAVMKSRGQPTVAESRSPPVASSTTVTRGGTTVQESEIDLSASKYTWLSDGEEELLVRQHTKPSAACVACFTGANNSSVHAHGVGVGTIESRSSCNETVALYEARSAFQAFEAMARCGRFWRLFVFLVATALPPGACATSGADAVTESTEVRSSQGDTQTQVTDADRLCTDVNGMCWIDAECCTGVRRTLDAADRFGDTSFQKRQDRVGQSMSSLFGFFAVDAASEQAPTDWNEGGLAAVERLSLYRSVMWSVPEALLATCGTDRRSRSRTANRDNMRMYEAAELRKGSARPSLSEKELVASEKCEELPLSMVAGRPLRVLSQKAYTKEADEEDISIQATGCMFCRRLLGEGDVLWELDWDKDREKKREECLRGYRGLEKKETPGKLPDGPQGIFFMALSALRPFASEGMLPCRESEQESVMEFLKSSLRVHIKKEVLYVSGMPGTGKTASVLDAAKRLEKARTSSSSSNTPIKFAYVNAMCLSTPSAVFAEIQRKVLGQAQKRKRGPGPGGDGEEALRQALTQAGGEVVILVIDEVDALLTQGQTVLYRLFDWMSQPAARLVVVAIANTMDLPERLLPRVSSRLGIRRVNFEAYNRDQLHTILADRLRAGGAEAAIRDDALKLCAARVAAAGGDARKALQVCQAAVQRAIDATATNGKEPEAVTAAQMDKAEAELLQRNPVAVGIMNLNLQPRCFLLGMVLELRKQNAYALPLKTVTRRYEAIMRILQQREEGAGKATQPVSSERCAWESLEYQRRLEDCCILAQYALEQKDDGEGAAMGLGFVSSIDVSEAATALSVAPGDEIAKEEYMVCEHSAACPVPFQWSGGGDGLAEGMAQWFCWLLRRDHAGSVLPAYKFGGTLPDVLRKLYREGGIARLYQGLLPWAIFQAPLSRFGDVAANDMVLALMGALFPQVPVGVTTFVGSVSSAAWRVIITPVDTCKTMLQTDGTKGWIMLKEKMSKGGLLILWAGWEGNYMANVIGNYPWFVTSNVLQKRVPVPAGNFMKLVRSAFIGALASSISDVVANSIRVIKTKKQTSEDVNCGYISAAQQIIASDGIRGIFFRGLSTRVFTNILQSSKQFGSSSAVRAAASVTLRPLQPLQNLWKDHMGWLRTPHRRRTAACSFGGPLPRLGNWSV